MDKRQKLIVGGLLAAVVFAAYDHLPGLFDGGSDVALQAVGQASRDAEEIAQSVRSVLTEAEVGREVDRMMTLVAREWPADPFYVGPSVAEAEVEEPSALDTELQIEVIYGGFLEMSGQRLAILNDVEYASGELLEGTPLRIHEIQPQHVVLESTVDGQQFTVVYEDVVFFE